jgi:hypothetical protein
MHSPYGRNSPVSGQSDQTLPMALRGPQPASRQHLSLAVSRARRSRQIATINSEKTGTWISGVARWQPVDR